LPVILYRMVHTRRHLQWLMALESIALITRLKRKTRIL
jgi:hypothetical protein